MSRPEQVLRIEPEGDLRFRGPFSVPVTSYMRLTNPSDRKVVFKIKTTAPKKYCVRPNSGVLEPEEDAEIAICLQPFAFDPSEKNKHKFMVQSLYMPEDDVNIEQLWKNVSPDELMDSKLKCVFDAPVDSPEMSDPSQFSPNTNSTPMFESRTSLEIQKVAHEVKQLKEDEYQLKQENLKLKADMLEMKTHVQAVMIAPSSSSSFQQARGLPIICFSLAAILCAVAGVVAGKFFL